MLRVGICREFVFWPERTSMRITLISGLVFSFVCSSTFNAFLVSFMATDKMEYPIGNVRDILETDHKIVLADGSSDMEFFRSAPPGSYMRQVWERNGILADGNLNVRGDFLHNFIRLG